MAFNRPVSRKDTGPDTYTDDVLKLTRGTVDKKLKSSEPYRFFLSGVNSNPSTHSEKLTLSFAELLDISLGDLEESLHINFMIEFGWLCAQYYVNYQKGKQMSLLYEHCDEDFPALEKAMVKMPTLKYQKVKPLNAFGHHHSKMSIFAYKDGSIRIVVMTANLREEDWTDLTQGVWVSPKFPVKNKDNKSDGDSKTGFKKDVLRYLNSYNVSLLNSWIQKIERADLSEANIPGTHDEPIWGQSHLRNILKTHACIPSGAPSDWPIIAQCSSLGSLGTNDVDWLKSEFVENLSASNHRDTTKNCVPFNLIYPSVKNVLSSWNGPLGACCLPYSDKVHQKQTWLKNYMCKWKCHSRNRTKALPHIKTYCRVSPCCTEMSWFLLTSANLSKAAWGRKMQSTRSNYILSHEAGVLFIPQFLTGCDTFSLDHNQPNGRSPSFPLPFDLPLHSYSSTDQPWRADA